MKHRRILSFLLAAAMVAALALPASANSSFTDVSDPNTAVNADVLRLMGAVSGSGSNRFEPDGTLTRAQFCVMLVGVMGLNAQVPIHTTRTIFSDVTAQHWARGYINLAASQTIGGGEDGKGGGRLISGVGTGQFQPDSPLTYAQAVTIMMRMLGYTDDKVGAVWPAGYMNLALSLGLTRGISGLGAGSPITRAQTAQLFVNMLRTETAGGQKYYETLGAASENVMILAVNVPGDDGAPGAIRTSRGTYHPAVDGVAPTALQGRRGALVLNERNEIVCFAPDSTNSVTVVLAGDAQATYLQGNNGTRYAVDPGTPAFTGNSEQADSTYEKIWTDLRGGSQVTLFLDGGKVVGIYYAAAGAAATEAWVVTGELNRASFHNLTGGVDDYTIKKNSSEIHLSDVQEYDVATYDAVTNTVVVSDLRLTCVYEAASPNPDTPETITAMGQQFNVLPSAVDSVSKFSVGKTVTLLLTADGQVAGMAQPSSRLRSNAVGYFDDMDGDKLKLLLPSGGTVTLTGTVSAASYSQGQVVTLSSSEAGKVSAIRLMDRSVSGEFDLVDMTLGTYPVAAGVVLFERSNGSPVTRVSLADIDARSIPGEEIASYHLNTSGMVDVIILNDSTGDSYLYGQYVVKTNHVEGSTEETTTVCFVNSKVSKDLPHVGYTGRSGAYVGVALGTAGDGSPHPRSKVNLIEIKGVSRTDFFTSQGSTFVTANGKVYPVSPDVEAFNNDNRTWFTGTGEEILSAVRAYSNKLTVYVDPIGYKVRVIAAN